MADIEALFRARAGIALVVFNVKRFFFAFLRQHGAHLFQRSAHLLRVVVIRKDKVLRRIVVDHKRRLGGHEHARQHAGEQLHHLVAGVAAQPVVFLPQVCDGKRDADKAVGEHLAFHIGDIAVAARPVGQVDRLVGEHVVFDDIPQAAKRNRAQTAEQAEDDDHQHRKLVDGNLFRHADAGKHGDVRRAEILVVFVNRRLHRGVERVDPVHQRADGFRHRVLLLLRALRGRAAERIDDVLVIRHVHFVGRVLRPIQHVANQQLVVGRRLIRLGIPAVLRIVVNVLQDVFRRDVRVAGIAHHLHIRVNHAHDLLNFLLGGVILDGHGVVAVAVFRQQNIAVLRHLVRQNVRGDLGHLDVLQQLVLAEQIRERIARFAGAERAVARNFRVQRLQRRRQRFVDHVHHFQIVVTLVIDIVDAVRAARGIDVRLAVVSGIHVQNFVEHRARVILARGHARGEGNQIARGNQRSVLALRHLRVENLLLLVGDDGGDGDAVADVIHVGRGGINAEVLNHLGDDVRPVDFARVDLAAVRRKPFRRARVGIFDHGGSRVALQFVAGDVVKHEARQNRADGNQKFKLLEVSQYLKILHASSPSSFP